MSVTQDRANMLATFRKRVHAEWSQDATVAGWRKWHPEFAKASAPMSQLIVEACDIRLGMQVLDLASGSGEPAMTLARAVGPTGCVTATDVSPGMLDIAVEQAAAQGLDNVAFQVADMEALPFPEASFDRVTCRLGIMFSPDHDLALREMLRVLKPGGKVALVAWRNPAQPFFAVPSALKQLDLLPTPPAGAPHAFKFSAPGSLGGALEAAGFSTVQERHPEIPMRWPLPAETFFGFFYDVAVPFRVIIDTLPLERQAALREVAHDIVRPHEVDGETPFNAEAVLAVAERPSHRA
jgi:SAM-dependent methyltransferase